MSGTYDFLNGPKEDNGICMRREPLDVNYSPRMMEELCLNLQKFRTNEGPDVYPWADRFVMGFPLPEWQRPFVWTEEQQQRFLISVWSRGEIGAYIVNDWQMSDGHTFDKFSNILLDGQQRLMTVERYLNDQIAAPDVEGKLRLWSEVHRREQKRFINAVFTRGNVKTFDETQLRTIYDLRNFGGTPHDESQRALKA